MELAQIQQLVMELLALLAEDLVSVLLTAAHSLEFSEVLA